MSHHDAQHYAGKHAPGTPVNPAIASEIQRLARDGKITCAQAHEVAVKFGVPPAEVGKTIDLLEIRVSQCQLGLFTRNEISESQVRLEDLPPALLAGIENIVDTDKTLSCRDAWKLAEQQTVLKALVGAACNALRIKIVECQLGTF